MHKIGGALELKEALRLDESPIRSLPDFLTLVGQLDHNPGVNLETLEPLVHDILTMGWQGDLSPLSFSALSVFSSTLGTDLIPLSASGGMRSAEDVLQAMALGATTVKLHTMILDKGPRVIPKILRGIEDRLTARGLKTVREVIG